MANKMLTINGITFPNYSKNSSKRNFRLIFYIEYKDGNGETQVTIAAKPKDSQWKWGKPSDKFPFFPEGNDLGDSVELNLMPMRAGQNGFSKTDSRIAEIDGEIISVAVQFIDVFDASVMDILRDTVLPEFVAALQQSGFNPVNLVPGLGIINGIVEENFNFDDMVNKGVKFLQKRDKDKILYSKTQSYNGEKQIVLSGRKEWDEKKHLTGTYAVTIDIA